MTVLSGLSPRQYHRPYSADRIGKRDAHRHTADPDDTERAETLMTDLEHPRAPGHEHRWHEYPMPKSSAA